MRRFFILLIAALAAVSCFKGTYSESYKLFANFEYGSRVDFRKDSTYYDKNAMGLGWNYDLVFYYKVDETDQDFMGGFRLSSLEGQIRPSGAPSELDMTWRVHAPVEKNTYMVYHMSGDEPEYAIGYLNPTYGKCTPTTCLVANTGKVAEEIAAKFERGDRMTLTATGYLGGTVTGSAEIALADYTLYDKVGAQKDSIVSKWTSFDLSKLGQVDMVKFDIAVPEGKNVSKYFCLDGLTADIVVEM